MRVYSSIFLIALATLAFELTLSRLLSVITWYHIGFLAISVAMLGMTVGAITVFLAKSLFVPERLDDTLRKACYGFALSVPIALAGLFYIPFIYKASGTDFPLKFFNMTVVIALLSLPFYFSGVVISALLTRYPLPVNRLYASDLIGASMGCMLVLVGLGLLDAPSFALVCAFPGIFAGMLLARRTFHFSRYVLVALVALGVGVGNAETRLMAPQYIKGAPAAFFNVELDRWNSFSRISINHVESRLPSLWAGHIPFYANQTLPQRLMQIDGGAATTMRRFASMEDIDHLKYDVTNIAYFLRSPSEQPEKGSQQKAAIIGVGGGKDILAAIRFGYNDIVGIEINPIFVDLLQNKYREFAGIGNNDKVRLVVDEARSYLSHTDEKYDIIQMSLIDTWASTSAGAFSLSENGLYTVEGWRTFITRLTPDGIFTVSRWYKPGELGETGRMLSLAIATLLELGVEDPSKHIALVTQRQVATLILSMSPLTEVDLQRLQTASASLKHQLRVMPGLTDDNVQLASIMGAKSAGELGAAVQQSELNLSPPTDESPYFFNMLRLENLGAVMNYQGGRGVVRGNLTATLTLLALIGTLFGLTVLVIIVPLLIYHRREARTVPFFSALFFCLIGAGFMSLEIAFLQRLTVFLGHPIYALSILLFSFIASTGMGSLLSEKLSLDKARNSLLLCLCTVGLILGIYAVMDHFIPILIVYPIWVKCLTAILLIWPVGLLLGCYFPTGMSLATRDSETATPWYWALNGIFGVLFSALAVFISIYIGISINVYVAASCYLLTGLCLLKMQRHHSKGYDDAIDRAQLV